MNLLLANSTCKVGGVTTFLVSLRRALVAAGHRCELFFFQHGPAEAQLPAGWPVHFGSLADCLELVERGRFDVVHANNVDWPTGITAVRAAGARLVVTAHKVRENATYGWTRANCDAFGAVAGWIAASLQPFTDLPIHVVPNGIDTDRFQPGTPGAEGRPIVAWIGRGGSEHKRLDRFASVAPLLRHAGYRVWVLDQHGPERLAGLYGASIAGALSAAAERWAPAPFEEMPGIYREVAASGGCVVSTSQSEGLPLTLLEAQACGCPVIASNVRGNNECVSAEHGGILYDPALAADDLARLIATRIESGTAAASAAAAAYVRDEFSLARVASSYLDIYNGTAIAPSPGIAARIKARTRLSPLRSWQDYTNYRWGTASVLRDTAAALQAAGRTALADGAIRTSFRMAPSLYLKPSKGVQMLKTLTRSLAVTPREKTPRTCGDDEILKGRGPSQMDWYAFAAELAQGQSVLDVGCGSGEGLRLLTNRASTALGIDLDGRLHRPDVKVEIKGIEEMPDKSFDVVVCTDVIEHVTNDRAFLDHLIRVARKTVFVTTPNYTISRNRNPYHVREYTPAEFEALFAGKGRLTLLGGSARGAERTEITRRGPYFLVNELYAWKPTLLAAKVLKRLLGVKVWKHQAAILRLDAAPATAAGAAAA